MRRALIIGLVCITALLAGVAAYFLLFRGDGGLVVTETPNPSLPGAPKIDPEPAPVIDPSPTPSDVVTPGGGAPARLAQVSKGPVVPGQIFLAIPSAENASTTDLALRYLERQSGNVFHYNLRTGSITRTSNRTVPGVLSASWLSDASRAFVRYLSGDDFSTINTFALSADGEEGFFLSQNLSGIAVASSSVLTLASGVNGSVGALLNPDGTHRATVFTNPLTSLRVGFAGTSRYLAFTKPSAVLAGAAFYTDASGRFTRVAGPLPGLVALASPTGKWLIVSSTQGSDLRLQLINTTTNEALPLPISTIADKCAWAVNESAVYCGVPISPATGYSYPDDWYQGAVTFNDRIWKIDVAGRYAQLVLDFAQESTQALDAIALALDSQTAALSFVNKIDGSLWVYQL